jgi:ribosomal protein S18 acetylase RimI-like enzyme
LAEIDFSKLFEGFQDAFSDYDFQMTADELQSMLKRRGYDSSLSFGAFAEENDRLIAFTFNGIGPFNGKKTAYDTGTGTVKDCRGQGLATSVFQFSLPFLKAAGVEQYLLEVLQHNEKAVSVYRKIGFQVTREFDYYSEEVAHLKLQDKLLPPKYSIRPIHFPDILQLKSFHDFLPSWQNDFDSISRKLEDFIFLGAFHGEREELVGYIVFAPSSGDITQIAVEANHRRRGIGSSLLREVLFRCPQCSRVKLVNCQTTCQSVVSWAKFIQLPARGKQFEMILPLPE